MRLVGLRPFVELLGERMRTLLKAVVSLADCRGSSPAAATRSAAISASMRETSARRHAVAVLCERLFDLIRERVGLVAEVDHLAA